MRWVMRIGVTLLLLVLALVAVAWIVLPPVNVPLSGMLANFFPNTFDAPSTDSATVQRKLVVRDGYAISLFADDVPDARMLRSTSAGDLLVASPARGSVFWLARDADGDGRADARKTLLENLDGPNGLDFHAGFLYVAEQHQIGRIAFDGDSAEVSGEYEVVVPALPAGGNHWRKTLRFGPDGLMYVMVGSSCNVCEEADDRRAAMLRYTPEGEYLGIYASGLRNSAGFDWSPRDGRLYATDNGRDLLGDDYPPCELNRIQEGAFYGWPYANGNAEADPDLGDGRETIIADSQSPVFSFRAHNAPLGITFLRSTSHSEALRGQALVALHGSWNRSEKDGYKVISLTWGADQSARSADGIQAEDFLTGFLVDDEVVGRPAEIAEGPDGSIYISDDYANAVYRVTPGASSPAVFANREDQGGGYLDDGPGQDERLNAMIGGAAIFLSSGCNECHSLGSIAEGYVSLSNVARNYDLAGLGEYLLHPQPPMPPYEGSAEQRRSLSIYLLESALK